MSCAARYAARRSLLLQARARELRSACTQSEAALWAALRERPCGTAFRRQVPLLGRYIADFFAPSVGLVVEVDGGAHHSRRASDARRDQKLQRAGYRVGRLPAELVLREPAEALARIQQVLRELGI